MVAAVQADVDRLDNRFKAFEKKVDKRLDRVLAAVEAASGAGSNPDRGGSPTPESGGGGGGAFTMMEELDLVNAEGEWYSTESDNEGFAGAAVCSEHALEAQNEAGPPDFSKELDPSADAAVLGCDCNQCFQQFCGAAYQQGPTACNNCVVANEAALKRKKACCQGCVQRR